MEIELKKLSSDGKIAYLIKPILTVLQDAGGKLDRTEIKNRISDLDDQIAEFAEAVKTSKSTGNTYKEFNFKFNFAIKDLSFTELVSYTKGNPTITLTKKGLEIDVDSLDVEKEIMIPSKKFWNELSEKNKTQHNIDTNVAETNVDESMSEDQIKNDFKENLLNAIAKMSPKKFEAFSRSLLTKMGVEFTNQGVQISNDGGIDGYGYHKDLDDFRTTRVVIQCKRYNIGPVTEPDINQFLGAMNKFQADYGVFITNSRFTNSARVASREGSPITLIDGNDLVDLVIRYQLYITPVTTYILDDFYSE
ncbi:restriction endonuclease [Thomasclavelia cocleata]|uniref:restriction endonuclease n=1 Tax=Thomasclavelia cocleata TaxID=69824 RepID=UPI00272E9A0C|nr:restriction endonuclease [Thomasclavelia cocleata]